MSVTLLVLAAGLGTRFKGGIKQLTPVGENGELLMEYSAADAAAAGADRVIFIIRRDIREQFDFLIGSRLSKYMRVECCYQDINALPCGFSCPEGRTKPWGTVHAVLSAKELIDGPFIVINADDYYGRQAYADICGFLTDPQRKSGEQCMGGFVLRNTLSSAGTVTRGICSVDKNGMLSSVEETYLVSKGADGVVSGERDGKRFALCEDSIASMNMWGFGKEIMPMLEERFAEFLNDTFGGADRERAEMALPFAVDSLIRNGDISVKVIPTEDKWYGMTHSEDIPEIKAAFSEMIRKGIYPSPLFGNAREKNLV